MKRFGRSWSREADLAPGTRAKLEEVQEAQRTGRSAEQEDGSVRRLYLSPTTQFLPELGVWDTRASALAGVSILVAVFTGLWGLGGLVSGTGAVWLLPICGASILIAVTYGRKYRRQNAAVRKDGIERDGTYLFPGGLLIRSHDRHMVFPLDSIEVFESYLSGSRPRQAVRMKFTSNGSSRYHTFGNQLELVELLNTWLANARGR